MFPVAFNLLGACLVGLLWVNFIIVQPYVSTIYWAVLWSIALRPVKLAAVNYTRKLDNLLGTSVSVSLLVFPLLMFVSPFMFSSVPFFACCPFISCLLEFTGIATSDFKESHWLIQRSQRFIHLPFVLLRSMRDAILGE